jgi:hypothetical protein
VKTDNHISLAKTEVRGYEITRYIARRFDRGKSYVVAGGMGAPRLWSYAVEAAISGFEGHFERTSGDPTLRLDRSFDAARDALLRRCESLIERVLPDVTFIAMALEGSKLHVISVGPGRVYLQRRGQPQRLTPRDEPKEGLLRGAPARCTVTIEENDVILAGSVSAFSVRAIARLASVLDADPETPPSVLASLLTEPAAKAGIGAAAAVVTIR